MSLYVDIEKRLGKFLLKVKFSAENETVALLGPSGCGKSMTLKCIAGIEKPDRGKIVIDGVTVYDSERRVDLSPQKRRTGFMFQNYALFPNMTVLQNLKAGAMRENNRTQRDKRIESILDTFDLRELTQRMPHTLSGGQQQRVALARILVSQPKILLLDEPFSALDAHLHFSLEQELRQTIRAFGKSVILVSHDRDEVYRMSDRVAVMWQGGIEDFDTKQRIFQSPTTLRSAKLIGCENIISVNNATQWGICDKFPPEIKYVGVRASDLCADEEANAFQIVGRVDTPGHSTLQLVSAKFGDPQPIYWNVPVTTSFTPGQIVRIRIPWEKLLLLRAESEGKIL